MADSFGELLRRFRVAASLTQEALAELMRSRSIDLANQSEIAKLASSDNTSNSGLINGALTSK